VPVFSQLIISVTCQLRARQEIAESGLAES
jgi:hypothetical protein